MNYALKVENLSKTYTNIKAVDDVSFNLKKGEVFALIGSNGAGKTTVLRIAATLLKPTGGDVLVDGISVAKTPAKVREKISYLPDEAGAYKTMTGIGYLSFMASLFTRDEKRKREYVEHAIKVCGLGERLNDKVRGYSRGMIRKLLIARAIMTKPCLAILDEPTSGLDVINALEIRRMIRKLSEDGTSFLISGHNMLEIEHISNRVGIINKGVLCAAGCPDDLKSEYGANNLEEVFERIANS
ncbi:MAG: ABC transporter ATP-binding protein [Oscillospiraceae bacterium]|nr:ABC transporter ATP-binding protein [Oscillospiraceae bacterium]